MNAGTKPVLFTDDNPQVLKAIERDLTVQYGNRIRVAQAESGQKGLEMMKLELELNNEAVAFFFGSKSAPK
jgi:hypothetical protein